jgi:hypothetical protein
LGWQPRKAKGETFFVGAKRFVWLALEFVVREGDASSGLGGPELDGK